jgi:hypothetical protein
MLLRALRRLRHHRCVLAIASVKCRTDGVSHKSPARMLQTKTTGKSKQAKELYVVTTAGIKLC